MTFSSLTILRSVARCRKVTGGQKLDAVIATNHSMSLAGLILKAGGKNPKVVSLLTDYLPPHGSSPVRPPRRLITVLTRFVARRADEVWTVSPRIPTAEANPHHHMVPIVLDDNAAPGGQHEEIGYIGFPSPDHALEVLLDICRKHRFRLNIIGDSPYLQSIKHLAPPRTGFHGIPNDAAKINGVLSRRFFGYAVYRNTGPQSHSYYGIPSKTFYCLASNTPVVTTNPAHFPQNIEKCGVGRVVDPVQEEIEAAVLQLKEQFFAFHEAINRFREVWNAEAERFPRVCLSTLCRNTQ